MRDVEPDANTVVTAAQIVQGVPIPPVCRIEMMSADEWEVFTEEWATHLKNKGVYWRVRRSSGSGDRGLDVVAFASELGFEGPWDSFQCKHYARPLGPKEVCVEVAKLIYHSFNRTIPFNQSFRIPRRHVFISPKGVGLTVRRWLGDPEVFRNEFKRRWAQCAAEAMGVQVRLQGNLLAYVDTFDFGIFDDRSAVELVEKHAKTPFHAARFGGGLPPRGEVPAPPDTPSHGESIYIRKLLDAYEDELRTSLSTSTDLSGFPTMREHYNRQREMFYSAEALRNFARDTTPEGTFDLLRQDIYDGVVDVYQEAHDTGFERVKATVGRAAIINVGGNALVGVARVRDRQGVCHQLANDCELTWVRNDESD